MWLPLILLLSIAVHQCIAVATENVETSNKGTINSGPKQPNFVILFADDLGYGDLAGLFGHPTSTTPNLNRLGERSKVLSNFYVAATVSTPSR